MATKLEESRAAAPRRTLQQPTRGRHNDPSPSLPYITGDRPRRERQLRQDQQQRLEEGELQGLLGHHPARDRDGNKAGGAGPRSVAERQSASHPGRRSAGGSCCRFAAQEINTEKNVISGTLPASLALLSKLKARAPRGETPTQRRPRRRPLTSRLLAAAQMLFLFTPSLTSRLLAAAQTLKVADSLLSGTIPRGLHVSKRARHTALRPRGPGGRAVPPLPPRSVLSVVVGSVTWSMQTRRRPRTRPARGVGSARLGRAALRL